MIHYSNTTNPVDFPKWSAIDKLWGKALDQAVPDTYSSLSLTQMEKVKTVFAELVIRDCMEINKQELSFNAFEQLLNKYRDHFGVEL